MQHQFALEARRVLSYNLRAMVIKRLRKKRSNRPASDVLSDAMSGYSSDYVTIGELMYALHERGFGLLMVIFVLPNSVPIPLPPGVTSLFAVPMVFIAAQMIMGRDSAWLPTWIENRKMKRLTVARVIQTAAPRLKRIEKLMRPRWTFAATETGEKIIGVFCMIFAISIAIPLPWTNFIPGLGTLIMSLGLLSKDGVTVFIGCLIGIAGVVLTTLILLFGAHIIHAIF